MFRFFDLFNEFAGLLLFFAYLYQVFFTLYGLIRRPSPRCAPSSPTASAHRRYAVLICARNEERVIGELIASLKAQDYPAELVDLYVLADNCSDGTCQAARAAGATVYERFDTLQVGKGYALNDLLGHIRSRHPFTYYDGYFIFDADNIVDSHFISSMDATFAQGYDVLTSYRNSKNFGSSWVSASYSIWFLREARFLNYARMKLNTNCAVSGTGFLIASSIIEKNGGWPYHLLTEDIQFSAVCAASGWRIGYCDDAIIYDEQPVTFRQSWRQRMRWAKGFYQVNLHCAPSLIRGCFTGSRRFSCYDMLMTVAPCILLTLLTFVIDISCLMSFIYLPPFFAHFMMRHALRSALETAAWSYGIMLLYGLLTVLSEWKRIPAKPLKKLMYLPLFPLFMLTYIPISFAALFVRVQWKPIQHTSVQDVRA